MKYENTNKRFFITAILVVGLLVSNIGVTGLPPTTFSSFLAAVKNTAFNLFVPNYQATKTSSGILLETGNKNILDNASFEHSTATTSWAASGASGAEELTVKVDGKKSLKLTPSSQTVNISQDSALYADQFNGTVQGLAYIRAKTDISGLRVCPKQAGTVMSSNYCVSINATNTWGLYKVPFILGATSNGIQVDSNGASVTGTVYLDDAFVGAVDLKVDGDSSRIAGESYFAGTTSCNWARTSTSMGAFAAVSACPGPTIAYSSMGDWQTTDSDLPRQTINNLPAGRYKAKFLVSNYMSTAAASALAINDGSTTCEPIRANDSQTASTMTVVECVFNYDQAGNRVFELYAGSASSTVNVPNSGTAPRVSLKFILEYFSASSTYSSTNADTDWAACTPNSYQGFGTPSSVEIQCKRQGSDLLMKGKFIAGATTAVEARVGLPVWNGSQLTSKNSSIIPTIQVAGFALAANNSGTGYPNNAPILIEPSSTYFVFGAPTTTSVFTKATGSGVQASSNPMSFHARIPIEGWENSNVIIGQFNEVMTAPGITKPKTCYYAFGGASATLASPTACTSGTCVEVYDSCGTATPPTLSGTAIYGPVTWAAGTFSNSSFIDCKCTSFNTTTAQYNECTLSSVAGQNSWSTSSSGGYAISMISAGITGTQTTGFVTVKCEGQAP